MLLKNFLAYVFFFIFHFSFLTYSPPLFAAETTSTPIIWQSEDIETDTIWTGEIHVPHRVNLLEGVTLTIEPGTIVRFAKDRGLRGNGNISAIGTIEKPILFSIVPGAAKEEHWHQIMLENSKSVFKYCLFERASVGLHAHFSELTVSNCRFTGNETGMMYKGGPVSLSKSLFQGNVFGVVLNAAHGTIGASEISGNEVGIMVRAEEKMGSMLVQHNNIFNNSRYNLKMGDFNDGINIDAKNNWWGTDDPGSTMFDDRFEPGIGHAVVDPVLTEKLRIGELGF